MEETILEIKDLKVEYHTDGAVIYAVNGVNLTLHRGETLGLVGKTGAGKTTIARSIMRILQTPPAKLCGGEIVYKGADLLTLTERDMRRIRGNKIAMIFQDPMTALNPIETVGFQITETIAIHNKIKKVEAMKRACDMLEMVGIPPERYGEYPHQFSGGMKQRVVIAMALACNPELLLADEPTTALDVTIQAQVLDMMNNLKQELGTSVILVTHDLGVVASCCNSVAVIYGGQVVESGSLEDIFDRPTHPYTIGLFNSLPKLDSTEPRLKPIKGLMPNMKEIKPGCHFCERCDHAMPCCSETSPENIEVTPGHFVMCHLVKKEG